MIGQRSATRRRSVVDSRLISDGTQFDPFHVLVIFPHRMVGRQSESTRFSEKIFRLPIDDEVENGAGQGEDRQDDQHQFDVDETHLAAQRSDNAISYVGYFVFL